jgi:hypothetical protein
MRFRTLLSLTALVATVVGTTAAVPAPASFDITLSRTATGWSASCAAGCAWTQVSMDCAQGCQAVISERGMRTQRSEELDAEAFAFVVEPRGYGGWQAVAIRGTTWTETSVSCGASLCRVRVDGNGVTRCR